MAKALKSYKSMITHLNLSKNHIGDKTGN